MTACSFSAFPLLLSADMEKELTLVCEIRNDFLQKCTKLHVVGSRLLRKGAIFPSNPVMTNRMAEERANEGGEPKKGGKSMRD